MIPLPFVSARLGSGTGAAARGPTTIGEVVGTAAGIAARPGAAARTSSA